jgi:hypothetical protein
MCSWSAMMKNDGELLRKALDHECTRIVERDNEREP